MSIFSKFSSNGLEEVKDTIGGFQLLESNIYPATIKLAYAGESASGALNVTFVFDVSGREHREVFYITNKNKDNFYEKGGKKYPLPGFTTVDDICIIATNKPLSEQDTEPKVVKIFDTVSKKEVPTEVPVLIELIGQKVALGIFKQIENKSAKNDQTGKYEPTAETRELNVIDKVFHPEQKLTVAEAKLGAEAEFWDKWVEKYKGITRNRCTFKGDTPKSNAPAKKSLFG